MVIFNSYVSLPEGNHDYSPVLTMSSPTGVTCRFKPWPQAVIDNKATWPWEESWIVLVGEPKETNDTDDTMKLKHIPSGYD